MKPNLVDKTCELLKWLCNCTESYTIKLLESSYGSIPSCSWPNHSSDVVKWSSRGVPPRYHQVGINTAVSRLARSQFPLKCSLSHNEECKRYSRNTVIVLREYSSFGDRTFTAAAPRLWNSFAVWYKTTWLVLLVSLGGHLRHLFWAVGPWCSATCVNYALETFSLTYLHGMIVTGNRHTQRESPTPPRNGMERATVKYAI